MDTKSVFHELCLRVHIQILNIKFKIITEKHNGISWDNTGLYELEIDS